MFGMIKCNPFTNIARIPVAGIVHGLRDAQPEPEDLNIEGRRGAVGNAWEATRQGHCESYIADLMRLTLGISHPLLAAFP